jgi:hypothetical protein
LKAWQQWQNMKKGGIFMKKLLAEVKVCLLPWPMRLGEIAAYQLLLLGDDHIGHLGNLRVRRFIPRMECDDVYTKQGEELEKKGQLCIGFGNGRFDWNRKDTPQAQDIIYKVRDFFGAEWYFPEEYEFYKELMSDPDFWSLISNEELGAVSIKDEKDRNRFLMESLAIMNFLYQAFREKKTGWVDLLRDNSKKKEAIKEEESCVDENFRRMRELFEGWNQQQDLVSSEIEKILREKRPGLFLDGGEKCRLEGLGIHESPHLDELKAMYWIRRFGPYIIHGVEEIFQNFREKIIFDRAKLAQHSWKEWEKRGYWLIGVGNGPCDEHNGNGTRKPNCAANMVAQQLDITEFPEVKELLRINGNGDGSLLSIVQGMGVPLSEETKKVLTALSRGLDHGLYSLSGLVQIMNRNRVDPYSMFEIVCVILDQYFLQNRRRLTLLEHIDEHLKDGVLMTRNGKDDTVALRYGILESQSTSDEIANLAFQRRGDLDLIIHTVPDTGHMAFFFRREGDGFRNESITPVGLREFAKILAVDEWYYRDEVPENLIEVKLKSGIIPGCPWWNFDYRGTVTNFSLSDPNREPTVLSVKDGLRAVGIAFSKRFAERCDTKRCLSCRWYNYGLIRCEKKKGINSP